MLYFDHNATSPVRPEVLEVLARTAADAFGNPSSLHAPGRRARGLLEEARERLAAVLGVRPLEIVFTSGGTEANRLALAGALGSAEEDGAPPHAVIAATEHPSVLAAADELAQRGLLCVTHVGPGPGGIARAAALAAAVEPRTRLVALQHANNETGVIQPVAELSALLGELNASRPRPVLLHVDAVQTLGKIPLSPRALGADLLSVSAHKIGGPKGAGALWVRRESGFAPPWRGGPQERGFRPGTENLPATAGFVRAVESALETLEGAGPEETPGERARRRVLAEVEGAFLNGDADALLPTTTNVSFPGVSGELLVIALDGAGVAVSTGAACASGSREPSHVLRAMGLDDAPVTSAIRISCGWNTTREDVDAFVETLSAVLARLRG